MCINKTLALHFLHLASLQLPTGKGLIIFQSFTFFDLLWRSSSEEIQLDCTFQGKKEAVRRIKLWGRL